MADGLEDACVSMRKISNAGRGEKHAERKSQRPFIVIGSTPRRLGPVVFAFSSERVLTSGRSLGTNLIRVLLLFA